MVVPGTSPHRHAALCGVGRAVPRAPTGAAPYCADSCKNAARADIASATAIHCEHND